MDRKRIQRHYFPAYCRNATAFESPDWPEVTDLLARDEKDADTLMGGTGMNFANASRNLPGAVFVPMQDLKDKIHGLQSGKNAFIVITADKKDLHLENQRKRNARGNLLGIIF